MPQREITTIKDMKLRELARDSIYERYRIIPYWYTVMREASDSGIPLVRPMWMEFPDQNKEFADVDDIAMIGSSLLIVPFFDEEEKDRSFVLPDGFKWFNYRTLQQHSENVAKYDEGRTLVLIKGGSIVTKKSETQKIEKTYQLMSEYPLELGVCIDDNGEACGVYYDDDNLSEDHFDGKYVN